MSRPAVAAMPDPAVQAEKTNLLGLPHPKLTELLLGWGARPFHATQIMKWVHHRGHDSFQDMTDLPKSLRAQLSARMQIQELQIISDQLSRDGTRKWLLGTQGGSAVETVFIPEPSRGTLCISSQVGCALNCSFCSTGRQGFNRNLTAAEMVAQVRMAERLLRPLYPERKKVVTNVVLMGMGEPLLNFDAVMDATEVLLADLGYGISRRRLTISTAGVVPGIRRMAGKTDVALAISLHAPNDELRGQLLPVNRKYPISELLDACRHYLRSLPERNTITIEYTLIDQVNCLPEHAGQLAKLLRSLPCKINLIPFNPFPGSGFKRPGNLAIRAFQRRLTEAGLVSTVRRPRGDDIQAACGQLTGSVQDRTRRQSDYIARVPASG